MSSGGKGGESKSELDPDVKRVMMDMAQRGKDLSMLPKLNYMGLTMAAPSEATQHYANQRNDQANLLGVGMAGNPLGDLPEATEMNGMKGYRAWDLYKADMERQFNTHPDTMKQYEKLMPGQFSPALFGPKDGNTSNVPNVPNVPGAPNIDWEMLQRLYGVRMP